MKRALFLTVLGVLAAALALLPATRGDDAGNRDPHDLSLFQFVRLQYNGYMLGGWTGGGFVPPWRHDYPQAEQNFLNILGELTSIETTPKSFKVLRMHDPEIMNYPFVYVSEPGFWDATESEVENVRKYLDRGGFILFDDFRGTSELRVLFDNMRRIYPDRAFRELTLADPVFSCFYNIESLDLPAPYRVPGRPTFYGLHDDEGRLQAVAAWNNDIGDYWEWSHESFTPIQYSNEAYKFGVNFVMYALTH